MKLSYVYPQLFREGKNLSEEIIRMMRNLQYNMGVYQKTVAKVVNTNDDDVVKLTGDQTVAGKKTFSSQIESTLATGTSPLDVDSTTVNTNLNADLLDGQHGTYYAGAAQPTPTEVSSFTNSWVNFHANNNHLRYWKDTTGMVHLVGRVKDGTMGASITTLPSGYYPSAVPGGKSFAAIDNTTPSMGFITVNTSGEVLPYLMTTNTEVRIHCIYRVDA